LGNFSCRIFTHSVTLCSCFKVRERLKIAPKVKVDGKLWCLVVQRPFCFGSCTSGDEEHWQSLRRGSQWL
jgi:hypothetical protein